MKVENKLRGMAYARGARLTVSAARMEPQCVHSSRITTTLLLPQDMPASLQSRQNETRFSARYWPSFHPQPLPPGQQPLEGDHRAPAPTSCFCWLPVILIFLGRLTSLNGITRCRIPFS